MNTPIPEWMLQHPVEPAEVKHVATVIKEFPTYISQMSSELRELEKQTFSVAFESALEHVASGSTLSSFCREYHTRLSEARFRAWIRADPRRRSAYEEASAIWADVTADQLIRISDGIDPEGNPSPNDVQRSQLQIGTRKWLMAKRYADRYGDLKRIEQTTTTRFDPSTATAAQLQQQLLEALGLTAGDGLLSSAIDITADDFEEIADEMNAP